MASEIKLDLFQNRIVMNKTDAAMTVFVDDFFDSDSMKYIFATDAGYDTIEEYLESYYKEIEEIPDYFDAEAVNIDEHKKLINLFSKKFDIKSLYEKSQTKETLTTAFSGAAVNVALGEGILDFAYAQFEKAFEQSKDLYNLFSMEMLDAIRGDFYKEETTPVTTPSKDEAIIEMYEQYTNTVRVFENVMSASIYSSINPAVLAKQNKEAFEIYKKYILDLQKEMLSLIEFCYDENFHTTLLGSLTAAQRFNLYSKINNKSTSFVREEIYQIEDFSSTHNLFAISDASGLDKDALADFSNEFNLSTDVAQMYFTFPNNSSVYYKCSTIFDMLMFEFTKMLEFDVRFRKCKNCGKYFILKGNYKTDFCDRVADGESKSCQTIGSLKNYRSKVKNNASWNLYNKYYKRYFARMKAGNIDADAFKKWQYTATAMRDDCNAGKISASEFEKFLFGSFVNRRKGS